MKIVAKTKVSVTIEVSADSPWDGSCKCEEIFSRASKEAVEAVAGMLKSTHGMRLLGPVVPSCVITTEER